MTATRNSLSATNRLIGMDKETSAKSNKNLLKERMLNKEIEILEVRVKMLDLKKDITRISIDLLQNEKIILFLGNLDEPFLQNEHSDSTMTDKSVNLEKYIVEKPKKVDEFDIAKHTITQLTNLKTPVKLKDSKKITKLLANNMINENKLEHRKGNVEIEEMWVKSKCVLDNNDDYSKQISTLENKIQQIIEEFENECKQLH